MDSRKEIIHKLFSDNDLLSGYEQLYYLGGIRDEDQLYNKVITLFKTGKFVEAEKLFNYHTHHDNIIFYLVIRGNRKYMVSVKDPFDFMIYERIIEILSLNIDDVNEIGYAEDINSLKIHDKPMLEESIKRIISRTTKSIQIRLKRLVRMFSSFPNKTG